MVQGNVPRSSVSIDRHGRDIGEGEILKIFGEKVVATALNAMQLTL